MNAREVVEARGGGREGGDRHHARHPVAAAKAGVRQRVLVVDDNDDVRTILRLRLSQEGFDVATAADGIEGLDAIGGQPPSCVLLDLMMPVMDGFAFLAALQKHPTPPPVFVVTQYDDVETRQRALQLGAGHVFTKSQAFDRHFGGRLRRLLEMPTVGQSSRYPQRLAAAGH